jgi:hypothetical protein
MSPVAPTGNRLGAPIDGQQLVNVTTPGGFQPPHRLGGMCCDALTILRFSTSLFEFSRDGLLYSRILEPIFLLDLGI